MAVDVVVVEAAIVEAAAVEQAGQGKGDGTDPHSLVLENVHLKSPTGMALD